jgi:hypothetical protein
MRWTESTGRGLPRFRACVGPDGSGRDSYFRIFETADFLLFHRVSPLANERLPGYGQSAQDARSRRLKNQYGG